MTVDLRTRYLGLDLANPLVVSSCPLTARVDLLRQLEEAGAAAVVLPSLFEEQIENDDAQVHWLRAEADNTAPSAGNDLPVLGNPDADPESYLLHVEKARDALSIPVIASLNGATKGGWVRYARRIADAGADALELNIYFVVTDPAVTAEQVEDRYLELVAEIRSSVSIPLAVTIGPYFSALPHMAQRLVAAGADGLVLFNRFLEPDVDLKKMRVSPHLILSDSHELRLPLRWIAILHGRIAASLGATSGVHSAGDVLKLLLAGADVVMTASHVLRHGPGALTGLLDGVGRWLEQNGHKSVQEIRGQLSQQNASGAPAFERANYTRLLAFNTAAFSDPSAQRDP